MPNQRMDREFRKDEPGQARFDAVKGAGLVILKLKDRLQTRLSLT